MVEEFKSNDLVALVSSSENEPVCYFEKETLLGYAANILFHQYKRKDIHDEIMQLIGLL